MASVYLASRFKTLVAVLAIRDALREAGHTVVSTWHDADAMAPWPLDHPDRPALDRAAAIRDVEQIRSADVIVLFSEGCELTPGGLWFELGLAYGLEKRCIVIGPPINVFCRLLEIHVMPDTATALKLLHAMETSDLVARLLE